MIELFNAIPDVDVLVRLEPEELGSKLLFCLKSQPRMFTCGGLISSIEGLNRFGGDIGYPRDRLGEVEVALTEAFAWLETEGLLRWPDQTNGGNGFRVLSRRAERLAERVSDLLCTGQPVHAERKGQRGPWRRRSTMRFWTSC